MFKAEMRYQPKRSRQGLRTASLAAGFVLWSCVVIAAEPSAFDIPIHSWDSDPSETAEHVSKDAPPNCEIRVFQNGAAVTPVPKIQGVNHYDLKFGIFRIEMSDVRCAPGIARILDPKGWVFLGMNKEVVSLHGYAMAGLLASPTPLESIPFTQVEAPASSDMTPSHHSAMEEHALRAKREGTRPPLLSVRRSHWPFFGGQVENIVQRTWAEFVLTPRPTQDGRPAVSIQPVVVYTHTRPDLHSGNKLDYLRPHMMVLRFEGTQ